VKACINSSGDKTVPKTLDVAFRADDRIEFVVTRGLAHCGQVFPHRTQFGEVCPHITLFDATFLLQTSPEVHRNHAGLVLEVTLQGFPNFDGRSFITDFHEERVGDGRSDLLLDDSLPSLPLLQFGLPFLDSPFLLWCVRGLSEISGVFALGILSWDHPGLHRTYWLSFGAINVFEESPSIH
jgi:hypothetical protein